MPAMVLSIEGRVFISSTENSFLVFKAGGLKLIFSSLKLVFDGVFCVNLAV